MASAVSNLRATSTTNSGNDRFNLEAKSWDSRPFVHEASREAATAILTKCRDFALQPKQVLEIGCGTGILSFLLAPHVERIVAVDAAEGMIEMLRQKLARPRAPENVLPVAVLLEDPEDESLPAASGESGERVKFDLVTSHLVLHHIPDLKAVLTTMLGCLAPGGRVMLTDFEDFGPETRRFHPASKMGGVERHGINAAEMTGLMESVGFANVEVKPAWTMSKRVERYEGEFTEQGMVRPDMEEFGEEAKRKPEEMGEMMDFPFVLCYGERAT